MTTRFKHSLEDLLLPEIREIEAGQREAAMKRADGEPFDILEWAGVLLGLILTVAMTRYSTTGLDVGMRVLLIGVNLLVAVPILTLFAGPFLIRCRRRGLRAYLRERDRHTTDRRGSQPTSKSRLGQRPRT